MTQKSTIERILRSAIDLFAEKGFHETKVDEIAERSNVAKGTIYLYFRSKEMIMEECVKFITEKAIDNYMIDNEKTFKENLMNVILRNYEFVKENLNFYKVLFSIIYKPRFKNLDKIKCSKEKIVDKVMDLIRKGVEEGEVRDDISIYNLSEFTLSFIHSAMMSIVLMIIFEGKSQSDLDAFVNDIFSFLVSGLGGKA